MTSQTSKPDLVEPLIEEVVEVEAPPARVWSLVSDLPRLAEWSPQVVRTFLPGGRPVRPGTRMLNLNRRGLLVWPTQAEVVRLDPEREVAFTVRENGATWSFALVPTVAGTRIVHRRDATAGVTRLSRRFTALLLGGQVRFQSDLRAGMRQTLDRIKADAERG